MAHSKFNLDGPAFEDSTQVIRPEHVTLLQEEEVFIEAGVGNQIFQTPPGLPAPQEERREQADDALENSVLKCIMADAGCDHLNAFQEYEHYSFGFNSGSDCDVPEDELTDEMEDIFSDEDQPVPVNLQEEEDPTGGDHGQQSPIIIPVDDTIAIEENIEPSVVNLLVSLLNVQVTEPEDPSAPRHLDEMENIIAIKEDQSIPVNSQEEEDPTGGDHDLPSPITIPVEDMCSEEDELIAVNIQEEGDPTARGVHDQTSPVIIQAEAMTAIEGNDISPVNLHLTVVNVQVTEPGDLSTPRRLDFRITTFDSVYPEADQEVIPENQLDVEVQTVTTTSAAQGDSSSSNQILMDIHVDAKPPESEVIYGTSTKPL